MPTEQDWRNITRRHPMSGWGGWQFFLTFIPLFFLGGYLGASGFEAAGYTCVVASIGIALAGYEVPRLRQRRLIRASPLAHGERIVSIDEKGVTVTLPYGHSQYEWRAFPQYRETKTFFLFFLSPLQVNLSFSIPKRVMSAPQIEELRGILKAKITTLRAGDE